MEVKCNPLSLLSYYYRLYLIPIIINLYRCQIPPKTFCKTLRSKPFGVKRALGQLKLQQRFNFLSNDISFLIQGEILLLEFFINNIAAHHEPLVTESGKSLVSVYIKFHRELGNMVNTYFQTFLLALMAYLTLYINLADFGNR